MIPDVFFLIFGIVVALVGLIILIANVYAIIRCREKIDATIESIAKDAKVIRGSTYYSYTPVFSYTYNGKKYKEKSPYSTVKASKYEIGDVIRIKIDKDKPDTYRFVGKYGMLLSGTIIYALGLLFVILFFF